MRVLLGLVLLAACGGSPKTPVAPVGDCPQNVSTAVSKEHPDATQQACKAEQEHGTKTFEVQLVMHDGTTRDVELSPEGEIIGEEEVLTVAALPKAVSDAFVARYPDAHADHVERFTPRGRAPTFEITFGADTAMFTEDGVFIEQKAAGSDDHGTVGDKD